MKRGERSDTRTAFVDGAVQMSGSADPGSGSNFGGLVRRWLRFQTLASLALAVALLAIGPIAAYSSMFGSLAAFLPALVFALIVAPRFGGDSAAFLRAAVFAEAGKLLLTALVCCAVFIWVRPLAAGWFFAGLATTLAAGWAGLIFTGRHPT